MIFTHRQGCTTIGNGYQGEIFPFVDKRESLLKILEKREKQNARQIESKTLELKYEKERQYQQELHKIQREMWEEKLDVELDVDSKICS